MREPFTTPIPNVAKQDVISIIYGNGRVMNSLVAIDFLNNWLIVRNKKSVVEFLIPLHAIQSIMVTEEIV